MNYFGHVLRTTKTTGIKVYFIGCLTNRKALRFELGLDSLAPQEMIIEQAYKRWSLETAQHLEGEFSFVVVDGNQRLVYGARDRIGTKALVFEQNTSEIY